MKFNTFKKQVTVIIFATLRVSSNIFVILFYIFQVSYQIGKLIILKGTICDSYKGKIDSHGYRSINTRETGLSNRCSCCL